MNKFIEVKGARVNNLKNVSLTIPRNEFIVISGVSGSGKSSLAFDTLYAEGQRRYVESLSSYARQFLGRMSKPECDYIKGLPPAIAIEQKVNSRNPRSTVGTSTEIYEYLRLLYARIGKTYSPISSQEVKKHSIDDILERIQSFDKGTKFVLLSPLVLANNQTLTSRLELAFREGYTRLWYKNDFLPIEDALEQNVFNDNTCDKEVSLVIDRLSVDDSEEFISRINDSLETAIYEGNGACSLLFLPSHLMYSFSTRFEADGITFNEPTDNMFSFTSPLGACPKCEGFGKVLGIDEKLVIPKTNLSVYDGCVQCWHGEKMKNWKEEFCRRATKDNFPIFEPYNKLSRSQKDMLWKGLPSDRHLPEKERICINAFFATLKEGTYKIQNRIMISRYSGKTVCDECYGSRLKKEATWVKINGMSITDLVEMSIKNLLEWFNHLTLTPYEEQVAKRLLVEIKNRLGFLQNVGLSYLTLNRQSNSLSGGESQRINLTTSLGSSLVGSLYILDEPSIGLHSKDTEKLIHVLKDLQSLGNTVVVVEHDPDMIKAANHLIDVGPDAGRLGGEIVYNGALQTILAGSKTDLLKQFPHSHTLKYLLNVEKINVPDTRRAWNKQIELTGARMNNLRGVNALFPLNVLTVVTGVSGSGKSSLIKGILYPAMKRKLDEVADIPGEFDELKGSWKDIKHVEFVNQNPIGKSSRSNPATYIKAYDAIRQLFAEQPLSKQLGFTPQYFSFNTDGGRCEECKGAGVITVEMQFMADLVLECEACHGKRFKQDVLEIMFNGKNINDVLNMTVSEAIEFFSIHHQKTIVNKLKPLQDVGLGYIKLGQSSSTLSGGENQRVKLAYFIGQEKQDATLFIFDEPTTGLHLNDIKKLLKAFDALIARGHTLIVVEHNLEVIKCADYVIDMGPEGGDKGGNIICVGTPEDIAKHPESATGRYIKEVL